MIAKRRNAKKVTDESYCIPNVHPAIIAILLLFGVAESEDGEWGTRPRKLKVTSQQKKGGFAAANPITKPASFWFWLIRVGHFPRPLRFEQVGQHIINHRGRDRMFAHLFCQAEGRNQ